MRKDPAWDHKAAEVQATRRKSIGKWSSAPQSRRRFIGDFGDTILGLWGDGTDAAGKEIKQVGQAGLVIIDKCHKLIKGGLGNAMTWSMWLGKEECFSELIENWIEEKRHHQREELTKIVFNNHTTVDGEPHYLNIRISVYEMFIGALQLTSTWI